MERRVTKESLHPFMVRFTESVWDKLSEFVHRDRSSMQKVVNEIVEEGIRAREEREFYDQQLGSELGDGEDGGSQLGHE